MRWHPSAASKSRARVAKVRFTVSTIISRSRLLPSVVSTDNAGSDGSNIQVRFWPVFAGCRRILAACSNTRYTNGLDCHVIHVSMVSSSLASERPVFTVGRFARRTHPSEKMFPSIQVPQQPATQAIGRACAVAPSVLLVRRPGAAPRQQCGAACDLLVRVHWTTVLLSN